MSPIGNEPCVHVFYLIVQNLILQKALENPAVSMFERFSSVFWKAKKVSREEVHVREHDNGSTL